MDKPQSTQSHRTQTTTNHHGYDQVNFKKKANPRIGNPSSPSARPCLLLVGYIECSLGDNSDIGNGYLNLRVSKSQVAVSNR